MWVLVELGCLKLDWRNSTSAGLLSLSRRTYRASKLSLPLLSSLGTPITPSASCFLLEVCIGSLLLVREPTSFQNKGGNKMATNKKPTHRCDAATSRPRSARIPARRDRLSQRPFRGRTRISSQIGRWRVATTCNSLVGDEISKC